MSALRAAAVFATFFTLACVSGCGGAQTAARGRAQVRFVLEPQDARVYTDERFVGGGRVLAARPPTFTAGPRRFTITAEGYFPHDLEMELAEGTTTVRVSLRPIPR